MTRDESRRPGRLEKRRRAFIGTGPIDVDRNDETLSRFLARRRVWDDRDLSVGEGAWIDWVGLKEGRRRYVGPHHRRFGCSRRLYGGPSEGSKNEREQDRAPQR